MNWKKIVDTFLDELNGWLNDRKKASNKEPEWSGEDYVTNGIAMLKSIKRKGTKTYNGRKVKRIETDVDGLIIWANVSKDEWFESKGNRRDLQINEAGWKNIYQTGVFIRTDQPSKLTPEERFFIYCARNMNQNIDTVEQAKRIPSIQSIFIKFEPTMNTIINTMRESVEATGTIGSDEMVEKYGRLLDELFKEVDEAHTAYKDKQDEMERLDREAVNNSLLERLKREEDYLNYINRG